MADKDHSSNLHDESEETISLCDLPVSGYESCDTSYSSTASEDSKDDESFEFFSQEWLNNNENSNFSPEKNITFGGNLFFHEKPISKNFHEFKKQDQGSSKDDLDSYSSRKSEFAKLISMNKGRNYGGKHEKKSVFPDSASMKSRWYYYGFGLAGIPTEMELSAIKSRQNRHRKTDSGGGRKEENGGFRQRKGFRRLIRDLSCDGQTEASSMVKASLVCIPRV